MTPIRRTRVLLVGLPNMLHEIIEDTIESDPDLELVGPMKVPVSLFEAVRAKEPDFVITSGSDERLWPDCGEILREHPRTRVLAVAEEGNGYLYEMSPRRVPLGELSPPRLLSVLRDHGGSVGRS